MKSAPLKWTCALVLSLFVGGTALAKICKTIGPDGSITYTDRPGAESCADNKAASESTESGVAQKPDARTSPNADITSAAAIERSIIGILTAEDRVQRAYDFCAQLQPAATRRLGDAIDGWRERNVGATGKMRRALAQGFNGNQQRVIRDGVSKHNERQMAAVLATPKTAQLKWCEETTAEIEARSLDVAADLAAPLAKF